MKRLKLKPCPFCGRKAKLKHYPHGHCVSCDWKACPVFPEIWSSKLEDCIAGWNRRVGEK